MKISKFFSDRLCAPFRNNLWSWGAVDELSRRVYLRTNEQHVYDDQGRWILAYNPDWAPSPGHSERRRHIELMKSGYEAFAVLVTFNDRGKIESYDDEYMLKLGRLVDENGFTYAAIVEDWAVDDVIKTQASYAEPGHKCELCDDSALVHVAYFDDDEAAKYIWLCDRHWIDRAG